MASTARRTLDVCNVLAEVHRVVKDAHDADRPSFVSPVEDEVTSSPPLSRDMQGAETWLNVIPRPAIGKIWIV